ncbi:hypothetical protein BHU72_13510 [Desulfuribacillus stibiiarsenatis]|uniref:Diguanylate cyclase n=1 Tax=Desulfuribacillus stibiiarsenatis TaxID=1390249 RepID=A0A1E5L8F6_9FIRM|nr:diguanylate cyclase [Desulfuribacillus stibiiarsenatis]OEH86430.1 hypothetical protein BHU72_13510 [Desulfuribacillus stibiiarsenatis]
MFNQRNDVMRKIPNVEQLLSAFQDGVIITDRFGQILMMNEVAQLITGWTLLEAKGKALATIFPVHLTEGCTALMTKSGDEVYVEMFNSSISIIAANEDKENTLQMTIFRIVSACSMANELLVVSEQNLRMVFNSVYDGIIIHDLQGKIIDVNDRMLEMYKLERYEAIHASVEELSSPENDINKLPSIWLSVLNGESQFFEWKARRPHDDVMFDVEVSLRKIQLHHQEVILATVRDISERKQTEEIIRYLSFNDKLTGLFNRAFFEEELKRLDEEQFLPLSIIMADVNGLKLVNDAFGHMAGDKLIKNVARALSQSTRTQDVVARWGGDEFAIILPNTDEAGVTSVCNRVKSICAKTTPDPIVISVALGSATKIDAKQENIELIKQAENTMYVNKLKEGRNNRRKIILSILDDNTKSAYETQAHIQRVEQLTTELGNALELDLGKIEELTLLARIHDIGKVAVPNEILQKNEGLSEDEWDIVRKHSEIGYRIISTYPEYAQVADEILAHHERWDGTGYPRQLKGEEIPLGARILSLVEAYEVMVAGRPYQEAMTHEQAMKEIIDCSGTQFDPHIVKKFIKVVENIKL